MLICWGQRLCAPAVSRCGDNESNDCWPLECPCDGSGYGLSLGWRGAVLYAASETVLWARFALLAQLNGKIVFIKGNHDSRAFFKYLAAHDPQLNGQPKFEFHDVGVLIKYDHRQYYMTHYPMMMGIVKQIINLHGHIHHYAVNVKENINVGVDTPEVDYLDHSVPFGTPFSLAEIEQMVDGKAIDFAKRQ